MYRVWFHEQVSYIQLREHCRKGGRKILRARKVIQDQMEMNPMSSWDPVHMNLHSTVISMHLTHPYKLCWTKTQHRTVEMGSRAQPWLRKYWQQMVVR